MIIYNTRKDIKVRIKENDRLTESFPTPDDGNNKVS